MVGQRVQTPVSTQLIQGEHVDLADRGISAKVCTLYDYRRGFHRTGMVGIANYRDQSNAVVAQHIRTDSKQFQWIGRAEGQQLQLFGQHLGSEGTLVVTEGEIDAMSVKEVLLSGAFAAIRGKYTVVSIPDGAGSGGKALERQLTWVEGFESVILWFDQDDAGRLGLEKALNVVSHAKVVEHFPYKDANEALQKGDRAAIIEALQNARGRTPDHIVHAPSLLEQVLHPVNRFGHPFPWDGWNRMTQGMKPGELWMLSAGTGLGKSLFSRSICLDRLTAGVKCAYVGLEEPATTTVERMLSERLGFNPPFHVDTEDQRRARDPEVIKAALDTFAPNLYLLDRFGMDDFDSFVRAAKHYVRNEGCRFLFLDHFSFLADGIALGTDQRRAIDRCIKQLKELAMSLNFTLFVVCHLSRSDGLNPHEEGGEPTLSQLRGSHSLAQVPDYIVMLQRNPRAEDPTERNITTCWLKKNRVTGELGMMNRLHFLPSCRFYELPQ
jgi:twinkle protein